MPDENNRNALFGQGIYRYGQDSASCGLRVLIVVIEGGAMRILLCLLFVALLAPYAGAQSNALVEPPFVRKWTQVVGDNANLIGVRNGLVYYSCNEGIGALDIATGKRNWNLPAKEGGMNGVLQGNTLYALSGTATATSLLAIDIDTHRSRILSRISAQADDLAVDARHLYALDGSGKLRAYDRRSGAALWTRQLGPERSRGVLLAQLVATTEGVYAGVGDEGEFSVDPNDGRILWHRPGQYAGLYRPLVINGDIITQQDGVKRIHLRTNQIVWKGSEGYGDAVLVGNVLVASSEKDL